MEVDASSLSDPFHDGGPLASGALHLSLWVWLGVGGRLGEDVTAATETVTFADRVFPEVSFARAVMLCNARSSGLSPAGFGSI